MTLSTLPELQTQFAALTARIAALDREIALETDRERRQVAQEKREELAREREQVAADITLQGGIPHASIQIEHRVTALEREVNWIKAVLRPGARQMVARIVFYALCVLAWSMWMIKEIRDWLLSHPAQAIAITLALIVAALIIRWLPEDNDHV